MNPICEFESSTGFEVWPTLGGPGAAFEASRRGSLVLPLLDRPNSVLGEEGLTVNWREPFDQLAEFTAEPEDGNGRELASSAERPKWLPLVDLNYRPSD